MELREAAPAMTDPLVSVIIPVYNAETHLAECLRSVLSQHHQSLDVVCVDDGSTDGSASILASLADRDRRVTVLRQTNRGVSAARNAGLAVARGDLVAFVDADDVCAPELIGHLTRAMSAEVDLVLEGGSRPVTHRGEQAMADLLLQALKGSMLNPPWGKLYRRHLIQRSGVRFAENVSLGEDLLFNLEYLSHARGARVVSDRHYHNRAVEGSLTRSYRPTKYRDLMYVHTRARAVTARHHSPALESLLAHRRVKSLISCACSCIAPESPMSRAEARRHVREMELENGEVRISQGDWRMRALGLAYNRVGLWHTARAVEMGRRLLGPRS